MLLSQKNHLCFRLLNFLAFILMLFLSGQFRFFWLKIYFTTRCVRERAGKLRVTGIFITLFLENGLWVRLLRLFNRLPFHYTRFSSKGKDNEIFSFNFFFNLKHFSFVFRRIYKKRLLNVVKFIWQFSFKRHTKHSRSHYFLLFLFWSYRMQTFTLFIFLMALK